MQGADGAAGSCWGFIVDAAAGQVLSGRRGVSTDVVMIPPTVAAFGE